MAYLRIYEGGFNGSREVSLEKKELLLGQSGGLADIQLDCPTVSRSHAVMRSDKGHWFIEDAGSRSGTLLNGEKVRLAELIKDRSTIQLGEVTIEFRAEELKSTRRMQTTASLPVLEKKMVMTFRPMPKVIRIDCRMFYVDPKEVFERGDTLRVGDGGIALTSTSPIPAGSVIEISLITPNRPFKSFIAEVITVLEHGPVPEMCIKLHEVVDKDFLMGILSEARRSQWTNFQEGHSLCFKERPRSTIFD